MPPKEQTLLESLDLNTTRPTPKRDYLAQDKDRANALLYRILQTQLNREPNVTKSEPRIIRVE